MKSMVVVIISSFVIRGANKRYLYKTFLGCPSNNEKLNGLGRRKKKTWCVKGGQYPFRLIWCKMVMWWSCRVGDVRRCVLWSNEIDRTTMITIQKHILDNIHIRLPMCAFVGDIERGSGVGDGNVTNMVDPRRSLISGRNSIDWLWSYSSNGWWLWREYTGGVVLFFNYNNEIKQRDVSQMHWIEVKYALWPLIS